MPVDADLSRVHVVGTSCSGKSTFARRLAKLTGGSFVDLDELNWLPGWRQRPHDEFRALVDEATQGERWVVAGNYRRVHRVTFPRATALVWLDLPFPLIAARALRRTLRRSLRGEPCCNGNRETLRKALLTRESILLWVATSHRATRRRCAGHAHAFRDRGLAALRLRSPREVEEALESLA